MTAMGRGLFSLYIYIEKCKNLLVRNHWTDFHIILQKCFFGDSLPILFRPLDSSKNMATRGRGLFSLCIYIENFKNLLVRNHWTNFNIILQKCSFGDPLPRLFKPFGFVKQHGRQGVGLFSLYIYIENLKNPLVRNHWTDFQLILQVILYQDCSRHLDSSKNMVARGRGLLSLYIYIENLKKSSCQKPLDRFPYNFAEMFLWWFSTKIVREETWPPGGGTCFPYISI